MTLPGVPQPPERSDPLVGIVVGDRYQVQERVGEGGMGAVYRAEHTLMKKTVAIKVLHPELGRLDEIARRFEREAQSASRLSHENIIQVTDFGRMPSGSLFLVMEFLRGESLAEALRRTGRMPTARAVGIARQVLRALEHAHAEGVVHRDLKPDNIMLVLRDTIPPVDFIKILDFGIAKLSGEREKDRAPADPLTQAGVVFGTPDYMSPEQAMGEAIDGRSDLYSLGVILYEMLTGRKPFFAESKVELISMHLTRPVPPLRAAAPEAGIPPTLERIVLRALEKKSSQRFASATAFLSALDALGALHGGEARRLSPARAVALDSVRGRAAAAWEHLPTPWRRILPVGAVAALALGLALLFLPWHVPSPGPSSNPPQPKPASPEVARPLKLAEQALARGELLKARTILTQELTEHPQSARVRYLLGNVAFLSRDPDMGLASYRDAIRLDPGYRADPVVLDNVRGLLDDKRLAAPALDLLVRDIGRPAAATLALVASSERRPELRHEAMDACERIGYCKDVDRLKSTLLDLQQAKTCEERRDAVVKLQKLGDRRALDPLRRARRRGGGLFGGLFGGPNECMKKELDDAIKALEGR